jgi:hypothetical protein
MVVALLALSVCDRMLCSIAILVALYQMFFNIGLAIQQLQQLCSLLHHYHYSAFANSP